MMAASSCGAWDSHYAGLAAPQPYGDDTTYQMAAQWVRGCKTVEDWGCGKGWLRQFCDPAAYVGVDGSRTPFADIICDVAARETAAEGIVLRHVLEHNHNWAGILGNAMRSFTARLFIAIFTPPGERTRVLHTEAAYHNVPVISFRLDDIRSRLPPGATWDMDTTVQSGTFYGAETVLAASRGPQ